MLKNLLPAEYYNSSSKTCGEIICQSGASFIIICKLCNIKIFEFNEFAHHLRNVHWEELCPAGDILNNKFALQKRSEFDFMKAQNYGEGENSYEEYTFIENVDESNEWSPETDSEQNDDSTDIEAVAILKKKVMSKEKQKQMFKCCTCQHSFTNKYSLESHLRRHNSVLYKCDKCGVTFSTKKHHALHLTEHNGYPCKLCTREFKSYDSLRYHKETHIQTKNFVCDFNGCNKAFVTKRRLHGHKRVHFSELFVCEVCGSRQRNKQALTDHIRKHTGEKPFACNMCDRRFTTNSLMNEHKACHETERKHICDVCGKSFNRPKALYHHKPLHLGVKKFVCKLCGVAYAQAAGLSAHMRKHKNDEITILEKTYE